MAVQLRVSFDAPADTTITLQGGALEAYYEWQADPSEENENYLTERIYDQCMDYVAMWSTIEEWTEND